MSHLLHRLTDDWDPRDNADSKWSAMFPGVLAGVALVALLLLGLVAMLGLVP